MNPRKIQSALISVYYKDQLEPIIRLLKEQGVTIYSTGGTQQFIEKQGASVVPVEELTQYPAILGGRVKTLHPKIFGGILHRREHRQDQQEIGNYDIPSIDLVIVDLYPFEETVASGAEEAEIIEKIDIGGISLIRAAAKNYKDVLIVSSREQYSQLEFILRENGGETTLTDRKLFAAYAFDISSHYDTAIFNYFNKEGEIRRLKLSERSAQVLRYGENPHQQGTYYGNLPELFAQLNGKELSYNNLVDIDAAVSLVEDLKGRTAFAIIKHTNACGCATGETVLEAYQKALEADPVSAFGGVLVTNAKVDMAAAEELNKLFFEILVAPDYEDKALALLKEKKNRILLKQRQSLPQQKQIKTLLNGFIEQDKDLITDQAADFQVVTEKAPDAAEMRALEFASLLAKHTKSNTIVLAKDGQLIASGVGQTSRVDALKQAIHKAESFALSLEGAVMASDAFFPFADCVEIAGKAGIKAVVQPGGSIRDKDSVGYCNEHGISMVLTGVRHFKH
ncbi:bifunctional phosphoribosylaminoimidazolecarboxamide formyltransferase/IMP cyclohydrolase [Nafulsella turpanensis]|uniref:bifunctional phosphoribosylaminoimidazolecarboxamide formyltransferase/IMP cyclohydrolase n=1 Tax=Nafulsella turpanensis TaxID=1265690 RepID=UPI000346D337|nr:bifunctional phosphoribosylaminoimidazolecarboxamide formyltransferase/IMP cyclohydrolase [Nafulsella turpanensis]